MIMGCITHDKNKKKLKDKELRKNPAFLDKVRKFLKENDMKTTPETKGMTELKKQATEVIPIFKDMR